VLPLQSNILVVMVNESETKQTVLLLPRSKKAVKASTCALCEASTSVKQCYATKRKACNSNDYALFRVT